MRSLKNTTTDNDVHVGSALGHMLRSYIHEGYMKQDWEDRKKELDTVETDVSDNSTVDLRWGWPFRALLNQGTAASPLFLHISHY